MVEYLCDKCGKSFDNKGHKCSQYKMKFIDLFCGIGGFHCALKRFDFECVFACDINKDSRETYYKNYNIIPEKDIRKIDIKNIPQFDILCAGFPCQSFSNAGKKKSFNDNRGLLFHEIIKIAKIKKPKMMFLENVKHIKKIDGGKVFEHILSEIKKIGYIIKEDENIFELSPHQIGIPQHRERIFFVCIRDDIYDDNKKIDMKIENKDIKLGNIFEKKVDDKYKISNELENVLDIWNEMISIFEINEKLSPTILCNEFNKVYTNEEFLKLPKWKQDYIQKNKPIYNKYKNIWDSWYEKYKNILDKKKIYCKLEWQVGKKKENDSIYNYFIQIRQSGIRVKKTNYFPTLVAIVQTPIYGKEKRYITPRECARLQSFPENFIIHENDNIAYKQFGNSVNVDVVYKVIYETLKAYDYI